MNFLNTQPWLPLDRIAAFVGLEPAIVLLGLALAAFGIFKIFLKGVSPVRHLRMQAVFANLAKHLIIGASLFLIYIALERVSSGRALERLVAYAGLLTLLSWSVIFVKTLRIFTFEYFFFNHMREGFPLVLVNVITLLLSLFIGGWFVSEIFGAQLAPLLATSAVVSIIFGLALQDTLGNLFAAISLQFDKPFDLGDWIEIHNGGQKWTGQVDEISWRATNIISFTEEMITIPNRVIAQAEILNWSSRHKPMLRSIAVRVPFGPSLTGVRAALVEAAARVPEVLKDPPPVAIVIDTTDSWTLLKLVYYISDFGAQYLVADKVHQEVLEGLNKASIPLAAQRIVVLQAGV